MTNKSKQFQVGDLVQVTFLNYIKDRKGLVDHEKLGVIVEKADRQEPAGFNHHIAYKILFTDGRLEWYPESIVKEYASVIQGVGKT